MAEGEDWLWRPVMRGMIHADRLIDRSVDLAFVAIMNEAIDVELENQQRAREQQAQARRTKKG